ncbi:MAG: chemotaxis protein CheB [Jatrophihabitans sp.]|uniref:chemotaxis protein CheB n=1 Tax=Jatrophihabitans sp. TaxID=1932789 RepID=UPI003F7E9E1E
MRATPPDLPVVGVVCSAGGLSALATVLRELPPRLPAAVVLAQHLNPGRRSTLDHALQWETGRSVQRARDGRHLASGDLLVVPEAVHAVIDAAGRLWLIPTDGAPRPSADLLLGTLATSLGSRAIGVVLSGHGGDGATGAMAVHLLGGRTVVEDPLSAFAAGMPSAALVRLAADTVVPIDRVATAIADAVDAVRSGVREQGRAVEDGPRDDLGRQAFREGPGA